jgi:hypothetical protein
LTQAIRRTRKTAPAKKYSGRAAKSVHVSRRFAYRGGIFLFGAIGLQLPSEDAIEFDARAFGGCAGSEPGDDVRVAHHLSGRIHREGNVDARLAHVFEAEMGRGDPDNCVELAVDRDGLPDYRSVRRKASLPKSVAENGDVIAAGGFLLGKKDTAVLERNFEGVEKAGSDRHDCDAFRCTGGGEVATRRIVVGAEIREGVALFAPGAIHGARENIPSM